MTSEMCGPTEGLGNTLSKKRVIRGHALVVESDVASSDTVSRLLSDFGFDVKAVTSGVDAVIASRQVTPALILVATQLRDVMGADLVTWLRANRALAAVPVVAMQSSEEDTWDPRMGVFTARLRKPISAAGLAKAIRDAFVRIEP